VCHDTVGLSDRHVQRGFVVVVEDVSICVVVQQRLDIAVQRQIDGNVQGRHHLSPLARVNRVMEKVRINAMLQHVLQDRRVRLAGGENYRARKLLRWTMADVGRAQFGDLRVVVEMSFQNTPQLFEIVFAYCVQNVRAIILNHRRHSHGVGKITLRSTATESL